MISVFNFTSSSFMLVLHFEFWKIKYHELMIDTFNNYVECHYANSHNVECHYANSHYAECHYANSHYVECHYAECHYAECHYAECHYAECHYAVLRLRQKYERQNLYIYDTITAKARLG
jgi:hypothetical protein